MPAPTKALIYRNSGNQTLIDMLGPITGRVLDCGCGPGDNAAILTRAGCKVIGITIDPIEQEAAGAVCESVICADLNQGIPGEAGSGFDAILFSHILEHLPRPELALQQALGRLKPDGVIAIALPNVLHYRQRLRFLRGDFTYTETGVLDRTHLRFYTVTTAQQLLKCAGLEIGAERVEGGLPWLWLRYVVSVRLRDRIDAWALSRWPNFFAWQSLFIARIDGQPQR